jgi:hypothetical protein
VFSSRLKGKAPSENHRGSLAALRKRQDNLSATGVSAPQTLFTKYPALEALYDAMHQFRALLKTKSIKQKCLPPSG